MIKYRRSCGIGCGIMLILVGFLWLTSKMGWFNPDLFWPVATLIAGVSVLSITLSRGRRFWINPRQKREV